MNTAKYLFSNEQLDRLFPFYIQLNEHLVVYASGSGLKKLCEDCVHKTFSECFSIMYPLIGITDLNQLHKACNKPVLIEVKNYSKTILKGQFEYLSENNTMLFIGVPSAISMDEVKKYNNALHDFTYDNPVIDQQQIFKLQKELVIKPPATITKHSIEKNGTMPLMNDLLHISSSLADFNRLAHFIGQDCLNVPWDWDLITGKLQWGKFFEKVFGYKLAYLPQSIECWKRHIHLDDSDRVFNSLYTAIESREIHWKEEYRYLRANGAYAYVQNRALIKRNEQGKAIRLLGGMQDISKQKEDIVSRKLMESFIDNAQEAFIVTEATKADAIGPRITYVNNAFTEITGYTAEETIGRTPAFLTGPETDLIELKRLDEAFAANESVEISLINYKKSGEKFWMELSTKPIINEEGIFTHWVGILKDITKKKQAVDDLIVQKTFTDEVLNNIPADIAVFDDKHRYLFVNRKGISDPEFRKWMIGKDDFEYCRQRGFHISLAMKRREFFNKIVEQKKIVEWIDEHKDKEGNTVFVLRKFYPHFENGSLKYAIGYGIDITERRFSEIQLSEAILDLKNANDELEQFAYAASHDLQEPLRMITSFLQLLEKKYASQIDEKGAQYIGFAVDGAKRMQNLIVDLLQYSRAGRLTESTEVVDMNEILKEVLALLRKRIEEKNALIQFNNLPVLNTFKAPVRQILQNLIDNGLKYQQQGVQPIINVLATEEDNQWKMAVTDNGIGIAPEHFEKIFVIFKRLHTKNEYSGTGIGLAVTKKIIEHMGGRIWVESTPGEGTTFYFTIPKK